MSRHFPLFADLHNRPVLLVGAGHVAARKAEDLLRAGARLRVVARELSPVFQDWLAAGRITYLGAAFAPAQTDGVFLVVAATFSRRRKRRANCAMWSIHRIAARISCQR